MHLMLIIRSFVGFNKMKLRTRTVKRKTTNPKMELKIRPKRNARAPKMPGFLVEPVFKRTRCRVLRLNAENNVATETSLVATSDDQCHVCGQAGPLVCCSSCLSRFHQRCLDVKVTYNTFFTYFFEVG